MLLETPMIESSSSDCAGRIAEFERHLLEISNRLIASPLHELRSEIDEFLGYATSFWSFDGVFLYELLTDEPAFVLSHSYLKPTLRDSPSR